MRDRGIHSFKVVVAGQRFTKEGKRALEHAEFESENCPMFDRKAIGEGKIGPCWGKETGAPGLIHGGGEDTV